MKKNTLLALFAALLGVALGWIWLERSTRPAPLADTGPGALRTSEAPPPPPPPAPDSASTNEPADGRDFADGGPTPDSMISVAPIGDGLTARPPGVPTIGDILETQTDDYVALAKQLASLVRDSRLPMEERAEALAHAINLSASNEAAVLTPLVQDSAVPDELADSILDEALNRPLAYQADLYLEALKKRTAQPIQAKIREHLAFLTGGEDIGADPARWASLLEAAKKEWDN